MKSLEEVYASGKFHPGIGSIIRQALGLSTSDVEYKDRLIKRARLQDAFMKIMADNRLDAMIFPHQRCLVAPVGRTQAERQGILTSATGFPSIVMPAGFSAPSETAPIGMPIGIELVGRPWSDGELDKACLLPGAGREIKKTPGKHPVPAKISGRSCEAVARNITNNYQRMYHDCSRGKGCPETAKTGE